MGNIPVYREGELEFDFGDAAVTCLDKITPTPSGMSLVDFWVKNDARSWLIEIKDPSASAAKGRPEAQTFIKNYRDEVHNRLVPKARDSYCYLHLMKEDGVPMTYVVVIGAENLLDCSFLVPMQDELRKRLAQETARPWQRKYVTDGVILTLENFNGHLRPFRIRRQI